MKLDTLILEMSQSLVSGGGARPRDNSDCGSQLLLKMVYQVLAEAALSTICAAQALGIGEEVTGHLDLLNFGDE